MKRPEGFDPAQTSRVPATPKGSPPESKRPPQKHAAQKHAAQKQAAQKQPAQKQTAQRQTAPQQNARLQTAPVQNPAAAASSAGQSSTTPARSARTEQRERRRQLRATERERRRYERGEVRRFTRRARQRRITLAVVAGILATLVGMVLVAVYSPLLSLKTIEVSGTERIDPAAVESALSGQVGTPLALVDYGQITRELSAFPLIRSYVTETVPPDTVRIQIVERQPIGVVQVSPTSFALVDPAGVTVQESAVAPPGVPLIDLAGAAPTGPAFRAVSDVLIAMPVELRARVISVSARTKDDVRLVLSGVGQSVVWGDSGASERKAALLAALIAVTDPNRPGEFDVSAPGNGIFRPS